MGQNERIRELLANAPPAPVDEGSLYESCVGTEEPWPLEDIGIKRESDVRPWTSPAVGEATENL